MNEKEQLDREELRRQEKEELRRQGKEELRRQEKLCDMIERGETPSWWRSEGVNQPQPTPTRPQRPESKIDLVKLFHKRHSQCLCRL